jgi:hypothetical protein
MKSNELYKVWETFNLMIEDPAFDAQEKADMGREMVNALPPEMLCSVSKSSLVAIIKAMKSRLTNLGNKLNEERESKVCIPNKTTNVEGTSRRKRSTSQ